MSTGILYGIDFRTLVSYRILQVIGIPPHLHSDQHLELCGSAA